MHDEAFEYVRQQAEGRQFATVVEFGSHDVNGSIRDLFNCDFYHGIDLVAGPGVDEVADASDWESPWQDIDCVVCCEVLEHTLKVEQIINSAFQILAQDGIFIVTCATDPREPHSAIDG